MKKVELNKIKDDKRIITILMVLGVILLAIIIFRIINKSLNDKNIYNKPDGVVDTDKNNSKDDSNDNKTNEEVKDNNDKKEENDDSRLKTIKYEISKDNLYVSRQEEKYKSYARDTKIRIEANVDNHDYLEYYIENDKLFVKNEVDSKEVNLNGEIPKYLTYGRNCGMQIIGCITNEGNIYTLYFSSISGDEEFKKVYSKNNAKELVIINQSVFYTTCGDISVLGLINNELYDISRGVILRDISHPYSIRENVNDIYASLIMYPDGSIDKYLYNSSFGVIKDEPKIDADYLKIDGNVLKISYLFNSNKKTYLIDVNGNLYEVTNNEETDDKKILLKLEKSKIINEKIKYVEISSVYDFTNKGFDDKFYGETMSQITLYGENGTKVEMIR